MKITELEVKSWETALYVLTNAVNEALGTKLDFRENSFEVDRLACMLGVEFDEQGVIKGGMTV